MYEHHLAITKGLSEREWRMEEEKINVIVRREHARKAQTLRWKLRRLKSEQLREQNETRRDRREPTVIGNNVNKFPFVINRSSVVFTDEQMQLLNKGLKYRIKPKNIPWEEIAVNIETAIEKLPFERKIKMREGAAETMTSSKTTKPSNEWRVVKELKELPVVFSFPDKGKGTVILDKSTYHDTMMEHLKNGPYELWKTRAEHPVDKCQKMVKEQLQEIASREVIDAWEVRRLTVTNPRIPRLAGLPKIHKAGNNIRPVLTNIDAPASKIAKFLVSKFRTLKSPQSYSVKNCFEAAEKLKELTINDDETMISYDVVTLFPSTPELEAVQLLKEWLCEQDLSTEEVEKLWDLTDVVVSQKFLQYDNLVYRQTSGLSIGCPLSPWLAEIFMCNLEKRIMAKDWAPRFYMRYVDDSFAIIKKSQVEEILGELNKMHEKIKFTQEMEKEGKIPFLDLLIKRSNGKIKFGIFRKPTDNPQIIPSDSFHPMKYKKAAFESMIHRLLNIPLDKAEYNKELEYIKHTARINGYGSNVIEELLDKRRNQSDKYKFTTLQRIRKEKEDHGRILFMNYCPPMSDRIFKLAKENHITSVHTTRGALKDCLINLKDKRPSSVKSGIYEITCDECDMKYCGQTSRRASIRWKEHDRAIRYKQPEKSAVAAHCIEHGHKVGEKKLVKEVSNFAQLNAWESYYIEKAGDDVINIDDPPIRSKLFSLAIKSMTN
jgi:hypothetical protein